jgi:cell division protein FtsZ
MGSGRANGENRALQAVKQALESPLLNNNDISGARNILLNITYGQDEITMEEVGVIIDYVQHAAGDDADLIWGNGCDPSLDEDLKVTVIATGFGTNSIPELYVKERNVEIISLNSEQHATKVELVNDTPEIDTAPIRQNSKPKNQSLTGPSQRVIEFDVKAEGFEVKTAPPTKTNEIELDIQPTSPKPAAPQASPFAGTSNNKWANLDEIENIPAFKRRNMNIEPNETPKSTTISKVTLSDDDIIINPENPYLYYNVD